MLARALVLVGLVGGAAAQCAANPPITDYGTTDCTNTVEYNPDFTFQTTCGAAKNCGFCDYNCVAGKTGNTRAKCVSGSWTVPIDSPETSLQCIDVPCPALSVGAGGGSDCICEAGLSGTIVWNAPTNTYLGECHSDDEPICHGSGFNSYFVCDNSGSVGNQMKTAGTDFVERLIHSLWDQPGAMFDIVYFDSIAYDKLNPPTDDRALINASIAVMRNTNSGGSTYIDEGLHSAKLEIEKMICPDLQASFPADSGHWYNNPRTNQDRIDCMQEATDKGTAVPISVVFLLSDGATSNIEWAVYEADDIKFYGGYLFTLGIGGADPGQLSQMRSSPDGLFSISVSDYSQLVGVADTLLNEFCLDIADIALEAHVCLEAGVLAYNVTTFRVPGHGFEAPYVAVKEYLCLFKGSGLPAFPGRYINNYFMECDFDFAANIPNNTDGSYNASYIFDLEISVDGKTFTSTPSTVAVIVDPFCPEPIINIPPEPVEAEAIAGGVVGGLIFLLCLLWFLWPLLFGTAAAVVVKKAPAIPAASSVIAAPKPVPAPVAAPVPVAAAPAVVQKKKWAVVDTSSYVWDTGGGGAGPVHTQWGELGATAAAPTLNAKTTEVEADVVVPQAAPQPAPVQEAPAPAPVAPNEELYKPEGRSCCSTLCLKCMACYAVCSALRPQRASAKEAGPQPVEMSRV